MRKAADHDVIQRGHAAERLHNLVGAHKAFAAQAPRLHAGNVLCVEGHFAGGWREEAGNQVEERRLPGAVRADQGVDLAFFDRHGKVIDCLESAKVFGKMFDLQNLIHFPSAPFFLPILRKSFWMIGRMPSGKKRMQTISMMP